MVRTFGKGGFMAAYSLISLSLFCLMIYTFVNAPKDAALWQGADTLWVVASLLTLFAATLFSGSMIGNPSLPSPASADLALRMPAGVFRATRHPMMWSFALWGIAHILIAPRPDTLIFTGSIIFLALVGARAQEIKKAKVMGVEWEMWVRRTSFFPNLSGIVRIPPVNWIIGMAIWLAACWLHGYFSVPAAGPFRWL
jgi:uncharacterized membrane protein